MKGRAPESVRVLIPDDKEPDSGFHDVTLVDMPDADAHVVPVADLNILRRQWPLSVVPGMSQKQTDYESLPSFGRMHLVLLDLRNRHQE